MNTTLSARFADALSFVVALHAEQRRKVFDEPYVAHLLAVTAMVLEFGGNEDEAIAALLHDAIEDQGGAAIRGELLIRFGPQVLAIVEGCTDSDTTPKPPWQPRKEAFLARLQLASPAVCLVEAADKLHNVRSLTRAYRHLGEQVWVHFRGGREGTRWYYRAVVDVLRHAAPPGTPTAALVEELQLAVAALETLLKLGQPSG